MTIVQTIYSSNPRKTALAFSACLAVDKGVASKVKRVSCGTGCPSAYFVIADDGKAVKFISV